MKSKIGLAILMLCLISPMFPKALPEVHASDGTPFATHSVPGTIEAEDFNTGAMNDVYFAHPSSQVTRDTTYRDVMNVDLFKETIGQAAYRYVVSSNDQASGSPTAGYVSEYLKYTLSVSSANAGWFDVKFRAKMGGASAKSTITALIDGIQLGATPAIAGTSFQDYTLPMPANLSAGTHVLTIEFSGPDPGTYLDSIAFVKRGTAPAYPSPSIKTGLLSSDEVVVANVTASADATGTNDATAAIQAALDLAREMGGGVVFLPAGIYRLNGGLSIPAGVTLRGDWKSPVDGAPEAGTVLAAYSTSVPAISMNAPNTTVRNLSIWYPNQGSYAGGIFTPTAYPYTIDSNSFAANVANVTFYNSFKGINFSSASGSNLSNIYGTFLFQGITLDGNYEYSYVTNVFMDTAIWKNAPAAIANKPDSTQTGLIKNYTNAYLYGIKLWKNDGITLYGISVNDAKTGILMEQGPPASNGSYGAMSKINSTVQRDYLRADVGEFISTDEVWQARTKHYTFAPAKKPASDTNFYNVKAAPYNAKGDGRTDDRAAIQSALTDAGNAGGGTVFLPPGSYKISTTLSVPSGVELRGSYDYLHAHENLDTTVLLAYDGKDTASPDTATAFLTLNANAGIRGFTVFYPEQGFVDGSDMSVPADLRALYPIRTYPYTVRSAGAGTWMKYIEIENGYLGADFATYASNDFVVSGNWINAAKKAVYVGGGTQRGWVERTIATFGIHFQSKHANSPHTYGFAHAKNYTLANTDVLTVGNASDLKTFAVDSFGVKSGIRTIKEGAGAGPQNLLLYLPSVDTSSGPNVSIEGGGTIDMVGLQAGSAAAQNYARTTSAFAGTLNIYDSLLWGNIVKNVANGGGTVNVYDKDLSVYSLPLTQNKPATANSSAGGDTADRAVDGMGTSKWVSTAAAPNWLQVDLGASYDISRWVVKHAGFNGENSSYNTKDYKLQISTDGVNFIDADAVTGNTANLTDRNVSATGRYVRLYVTAGQQDGGSTARIVDFEVYGLTDIAMNRTASANAYNLPSEAPPYANDGSLGTKWASTAASPHWLTLDLGQPYHLKRWVVKHAGAGGEAAIYNTRDYKLQVSNDGTNFADVDTVTGNSSNSTDRNINAHGRYVRLYITQGTQTGYDGFARIYEFEAYGTPSANAASGKTATANAYNLPNEAPQYAADGSAGTKWASVAAAPNWLKIDLGYQTNISRWVVKHAGVNGESASFNTRDFKLQVSSDGTTFTDADTVTGNAANVTDRNVNATGRYVRLYITQGTQTGSDGYARIYELEVYN
ncbi:discoidin domain-containing protein [Cohnella sp. CFH 77786]|uniref:galactose-binding domain-containing protein n=1 Tax=Cohnella sp. CFH 77786 TaxID=2662265 RepID=UPI001C60D52D|nr:discoidin domain-containing protein [Cohnella sp. CFH 77786]